MPKISDLFTLTYGHSLELNRMKLSDAPDGINFVSRTTKNNGVSARVARLQSKAPAEPGTLSVALGGEGGAAQTFLQPSPYYCGRDVMILSARKPMTEKEKLWYAACITANHFRFGFGRQANKTLKNLVIPWFSEAPSWASNGGDLSLELAALPASACEVRLSNPKSWKWFTYDDLFKIERGRGPRLKDLNGAGHTPFVTSTDSNNGLTGFTTAVALHFGGTLSVNRNGSVAEAYYQPLAFCSTEDVHVFTPKFEMSCFHAMFLCTLIKKEQYRFGYGRKWGLERMKCSKMKLPAKPDGTPDWDYINQFIKSISFSSILE